VSDGQTQPDRLASLREAAGRMDDALHEEGFEQHGSHAVFVRWQRASVEALGNILLEAETELGARVGKACARMEEASRRFRDEEFRRAELLLIRGQEALNMARQAADTTAATGERAERVFNASVAKIARELSVKLLDECQLWLVLKQTQRNRRDAWRLAPQWRRLRCLSAAIRWRDGGGTRKPRLNRSSLPRSSGAGRSRSSFRMSMAPRSKCAPFRIFCRSKADRNSARNKKGCLFRRDRAAS
jgi:hypothetical protein